MNEYPKKLEFSVYEEETIQNNENIRRIREKILEMERKIQKYEVLIEEIKTNSKISEDEKKELITGYMNSLSLVRDTVRIAQETIRLTELTIGVDHILKEQADEILKRGENLDELTADIEQEDKPPRSVN